MARIETPTTEPAPSMSVLCLLLAGMIPLAELWGVNQAARMALLPTQGVTSEVLRYAIVVQVGVAALVALVVHFRSRNAAWRDATGMFLMGIAFSGVLVFLQPRSDRAYNPAATSIVTNCPW